jgi:hypothetical protein
MNERIEAVAQQINQQRPEPGDILLFYRPERFRSRLICWFTRSPFYHVGIYEGDGKVIEARIPEVMRRDLSHEKDAYHFTVLRAPSRVIGRRALLWAQERIGQPYDKKSIGLLALSRLTHLPFCQFRNEDGSERFLCGNFVVRAFSAAGVILFPGRPAEEIIPADFSDLLKQQTRRQQFVFAAPRPRPKLE